MNNQLKEQKNYVPVFIKMNNRISPLIIFFFLSLLLPLSNSCDRFRQGDQLKKGFVSPPDSAKPGVYWYIMDGNLDREGIKADLESMKEAGIGYALFLEVNVGIPKGNTDLLSEKWLELFTYAVREAERLGIKIILGSGPGWAGSGGPWVKPEQSMMHLVSFDTVMTGPALVDRLLSKPKPRTPYFGEGSLTPALREFRDNWYSDVRVLAFPAPEVKGSLEDFDEKALFTRAPYTSVKGVRPFFPGKNILQEDAKLCVEKGRILDISGSMDSTGRIKWSVPPGRWVIMRLGKVNNGSVTRPAPVAGLGFESDKFDTAAFKAHFEAYTGKLIRTVNPDKKSLGGLKMIHIDSWEMGAQNWSNSFMEQFIKRRGYDPMLYLPVLEGYIVNSKSESERFLWDIRQTSSELICENHAGFFKRLGQRYGLTLSVEPYDMNPAADFDLGTVADVPMGEFWSAGYGYNSAFSCIEATSIGHVTGKQVVAAEAFTADGSEAWKKYPGNMKNQTDWALAMGINRFIFHTFTHKSFFGNLKPGMTMGPYGVHWDRGQTWWPMVGAYHTYLSRCQLILSQGKPVSDILYLTPEGAPTVFRAPSSALEGTDTLPDKKGWSFDCCSPSYLIAHANMQESRIVFPGGNSYRVLVLPDVPFMTPELINKLEVLLKGGVTVIGLPPFHSPSLSGYPGCDVTLKKMAESIWSAGSIVTNSEIEIRKHGSGYVIPPRGLSVQNEKEPYDVYAPFSFTEKVLSFLKVKKDFSSGGSFRYSHRTTPEREIYFVSNRTDTTVTDSCTFRDGSPRAELWDPLTGEIRALHGIVMSQKGYTAKIRLDSYQSIFVVFYHTKEFHSESEKKVNDFPDLMETVKLRQPWTVRFASVPGVPGSVRFDSLSDWTVNSNEDLRYYSGIAEYSGSFDLPAGTDLKSGRAFYIDLGKVGNIARIKLNGKDLGVLWAEPYRIKVNGALKEKNNKIVIEVANLWVNRLIGDEEKPWDGIENGQWPDWLLKNGKRTSGRFAFTTHRYYKKGDPLLSSGLMGPVKILESAK
jgi:hypothetical protein